MADMKVCIILSAYYYAALWSPSRNHSKTGISSALCDTHGSWVRAVAGQGMQLVAMRKRALEVAQQRRSEGAGAGSVRWPVSYCAAQSHSPRVPAYWD